MYRKEISKKDSLIKGEKDKSPILDKDSRKNKSNIKSKSMSSQNTSRSSISSHLTEAKIEIQIHHNSSSRDNQSENFTTERKISKENSIEKRRARLNMPLLYRMYESQSEDNRGTISGPESPNFHPEEVAKTLRNALVGITTDDNKIISSIFLHTNFQRQMICKAYETMYERNLIHDVEEETGGFFMDLCIALLRPTHVFSTQLLIDSISLKNQDINIVVEIACTSTNLQLRVIKETYTSSINRNLEKDIINKIEGICGKYIQALFIKTREEDDYINSEMVKENLNIISQSSNFFDDVGKNIDLFIKLFVIPSFLSIREVIDAYDSRKDPGKDFESMLRKNKIIHTEIRNIILTIIKISRNTQIYFADKLHEAISGVRADHSTIIRIVVTRSETDLADIVDEYCKKYGQSPLHWLQKTCSGDYYRLLSAMLTINTINDN
ncbi:Annexin family and Annexin repeat-containing protein [Strongyloides ratti]|uniref:Annexin family and Annexin repeat-containing protein n=1 Tax=Strongyloides ratti TaxID=34506 RepID=A0A090LN57_STRRB|nr:Annexin family and Annexin repeat-containing protein [Strongyloides ratti]CEF68960.1 Annexin family and Annexin repeat-containing protein [Strongyloides ratti]